MPRSIIKWDSVIIHFININLISAMAATPTAGAMSMEKIEL